MSENMRTELAILEYGVKEHDNNSSNNIHLKSLVPDIKFKKIHKDAVIPKRNDGDACFDLWSVTTRALLPGERHLYKTGLKIEMPSFIEATIRPRSGMAINNGITVLNSPGTIDSTYRGEIGVELINHGNCITMISAGDRIAQMSFGFVLNVTFIRVSELGETKRGTKGFGSTGK